MPVSKTALSLTLLFAVTLAGCGERDSARSSVELYGNQHQGEATWYNATGEGNCSFDASSDLMVAAINNRDYAGAALCGAYLTVTGPQGSVTVRVVDRCPGCREGGLDLSKEAFAQIADLQAGRVAIRWQIIGVPLAQPVSYHYMDGSSRYWSAIQVRNHRWPIASLEIKPQDSELWLPLERRNYNYFVYPEALAAGSLQVRIVAITGARLEDQLPEPTGGLLVEGKAQF